MVTEFGMSEALGPVRYAGPAGSGYLGPQLGTRQHSSETAALIDQEVRRLVEEAESTALDLLRTHETALNDIAGRLQEDEVIEGDEVARIVSESESRLETGTTSPAT
jgi:cell division protease FtsH